MKRLRFPLLMICALILVACGSPASRTGSPAATQPALASTDAALTPAATGQSASLTRSDSQGAVTVEVTPLNLSDPSDQLAFDVGLNTHSVDLSMDLATLATLTTDTGVRVKATQWEATPGGHHVSGKLIFPATKDGQSVLDGAGKLTLTIVNVDAASRVFEWQLK